MHFDVIYFHFSFELWTNKVSWLCFCCCCCHYTNIMNVANGLIGMLSRNCYTILESPPYCPNYSRKSTHRSFYSIVSHVYRNAHNRKWTNQIKKIAFSYAVEKNIVVWILGLRFFIVFPTFCLLLITVQLYNLLLCSFVCVCVCFVVVFFLVLLCH